MSAHRTRLMLVLLASAGLALPALAQPAKPPAPPTPPAPLGGPKVENIAPPTGSAGFDGMDSTQDRRGKGERPVPMRAFLHAIRETVGPEAPEALRLSDEQETAIRSAAETHRDAVKAYVDEHREEIKELSRLRGPESDRLRELLGGGPPRRGPGGPDGPGGRGGRGGPRGERPEGSPPPPPPPPPAPGEEMGEQAPADRAALRAQAKALMDGAPKPTDTQKQIWALLRTEQQEAVQARIDQWKSDMKEREGERYGERIKGEIRQKGGKGGPKQGG
jgi:gas vesicle protein